MSSVRDLLQAQKLEITEKLKGLTNKRDEHWTNFQLIESRIASLRDESQRIDKALSAIDDGGRDTNRPPKIMQAVLEVLKGHPDGMTAQEILSEINAKYFDGAVVRPSLSPQLSRLKDRDKKVELRGNRWFRVPDQPSLFPPIKRRV